MDSGPTAAEIRRMNRAELDELAQTNGLNPEDYRNADELRAALLEGVEGGNSNDNDDEPGLFEKSETTVTSPDRATRLKAVIEPVEHDKGRRVVNVVKSASFETVE